MSTQVGARVGDVGGLGDQREGTRVLILPLGPPPPPLVLLLRPTPRIEGKTRSNVVGKRHERKGRERETPDRHDAWKALPNTKSRNPGQRHRPRPIRAVHMPYIYDIRGIGASTGDAGRGRGECRGFGPRRPSAALAAVTFSTRQWGQCVAYVCVWTYVRICDVPLEEVTAEVGRTGFCRMTG